MSAQSGRDLNELPATSLVVRLTKARAERQREQERRARGLTEASTEAIQTALPSEADGVSVARVRRSDLAEFPSGQPESGEPRTGEPEVGEPAAQPELGEAPTGEPELGEAPDKPELGEPQPETPAPPRSARARRHAASARVPDRAPVERLEPSTAPADLPETAPPLLDGDVWPVRRGAPETAAPAEPVAADALSMTPDVHAAVYPLTPDTLPLIRELEHARAEAETLRAQATQAQDELLAVRHRAEKERAELGRSAAGEVIMRIIPVVDDLERALAHVPPALTSDPWVEGVLMIGRGLQAALEGQGVERIAPFGEPFDPHRHEALTQMTSDEVPEGTITDVYRPGYNLHGRMLRPAQVQVAARKDP